MPGVAGQAAAAMGPANPGPPKQRQRFAKEAFEIKVDFIGMGIGAVWCAYAVTLFIYTRVNDNSDRYEPSCSVVDGRVYDWLKNMSYIMLAYGIFGLIVSGCVPKTLQVFRLKDEAICCSDICQGLCGQVTRGFLFVILISLNVYGSYLLFKAYSGSVQYEYPELNKTFCKKDFFNFSIVTNALILTVLFTMCLLTLRQCFLAMSYDRELGNNKYGPKGENLEKELGLLPEQQKHRKKRLKAQRARIKAARKRGRKIRGGRRGRGGPPRRRRRPP